MFQKDQQVSLHQVEVEGKNPTRDVPYFSRIQLLGLYWIHKYPEVIKKN